jgi:hypothetical protein
VERNRARTSQETIMSDEIDNESMNDDDAGIGRRHFIQAIGLAGAVTAIGGALPGTARASTGPTLLRAPDSAGAPAPTQLHLQFGADASKTVVASWSTLQRVRNPRMRLGSPHGGFGDIVHADERAYTDALTGETIYTYHAVADGLDGSADHIYEAYAAGSPAEGGSFRTGPDRRAPFRFTSFGDQAIPAAVGSGKLVGPHTVNAGYIVDAVEALDPLFHLLNGDLCYANVSDDPPATWRSFFTNNSRSARNRPWMPAAGNHENESGNGPQGYLAYQTWFTVPANGQPQPFLGNWYTFKAGNVAVVSLNNDDVCIQAGSFAAYRVANNIDKTYIQDYVRGYSAGEQKRWLEATLQHHRRDENIDWIIVVMHQVAMSSAHFNGADLGIRQEWLPLFEKYGVDLVVAGHEHHYERTHAVSGFDSHATAPNGVGLLTPQARTSSLDVIDTTKGTVHMIIGGGGHSFATPFSAFDAPHDGVLIYDIDTSGVVNGIGSRPSKITTESGDWSAFRDLANPYGFCSFDVDPGKPHGNTSITVKYYGTQAGSADYSQVVDTFTLQRPRRH